jgi:hypothetical protein
MSDGCAAPTQSATLPANIDLATQVVLAGKVVSGDSPVGGAFVRLLDANGDFAGEVVASTDGDFRFFAAPGTWTVRALHRSGNGQAEISAAGPGLHEATIAVA